MIFFYLVMVVFCSLFKYWLMCVKYSLRLILDVIFNNFIIVYIKYVFYFDIWCDNSVLYIEL